MKDTLRIMTVVTDFGIGGTQRVAQSATLALKARGHETAVFAHRGGGPRRRGFEQGGVAVFGVEDFPDLDTAIQAASAWRPDVIHIHRAGCPNSLENRIMSSLKRPGSVIVETNVFARFDHLEANGLIDAHCLLSGWCLYKWRRWAGSRARTKRHYVVPNPVEVGRFYPLPADERVRVRSELGVPEGRFLFGRVGQPLESKWSLVIFDSLQKVLERGRDAGLLLVGAPPSHTAFAKTLPKDVQSRIIMRPTTADDDSLRATFGVMDGFLHASQIGESFGMVLCEAMQCGVPVVTLSTPLKDNSQLEVVGHGAGGLVSLDKRSLPEAMLMLMDDNALRQRVADDGPRWVEQRFSASLVGEMLEAAFKETLASSPFSPAPDSKIKELLKLGVGRPMSLNQRLVFDALHRPAIYRAYQALIRGVRRS